jgi:hypothetical protein
MARASIQQVQSLTTCGSAIDIMTYVQQVVLLYSPAI